MSICQGFAKFKAFKKNRLNLEIQMLLYNQLDPILLYDRQKKV